MMVDGILKTNPELGAGPKAKPRRVKEMETFLIGLGIAFAIVTFILLTATTVDICLDVYKKKKPRRMEG